MLGLYKLMLCSTDDAIVKSTWLHLGFHFTSDEQMEEWDIPHSDLVYLQNTVQVCIDIMRASGPCLPHCACGLPAAASMVLTQMHTEAHAPAAQSCCRCTRTCRTTRPAAGSQCWSSMGTFESGRTHGSAKGGLRCRTFSRRARSRQWPGHPLPA